MRLWRLGGSNNLAHAKYAAIDDGSRQKTLHLFRAILRQCTYLPDPAARLYLRAHVVSRFRDYHPSNALSHENPKGKPIQLMQQRRPTLLKTACKGLRYLQRANDGHPQHLGKILALTYGRVGKRRHQLLKNLKLPDVPVDQNAVARLSDPRDQGVPHPSQRLLTMIRSQAMRKLSFFSRSAHPIVAPQIPEKNVWGRPIPVKRVRNMKRRWYAQSLDRIMPPLPEDEWNALRKLALGESEWEGPVARRRNDKVPGFKRDLLRFPGLLSSPHKITPRYMSRLYAKILAQCPIMKPDASRKSGWNVTWLDVPDTKVFALPSQKQGDYSSMFEGVDENGKIIQSEREPRGFRAWRDDVLKPERASVKWLKFQTLLVELSYY